MRPGGGLAGKRYPWGDEISCSNANYTPQSPAEPPCVGDPTEVGSYPPNDYGLYDMAGNLWEWVNDYYEADYYSASPPNDPPGPSETLYRILRGGSYGVTQIHQRVARRYPEFYAHTDSTVGFRCARGGAFGP